MSSIKEIFNLEKTRTHIRSNPTRKYFIYKFGLYTRKKLKKTRKFRLNYTKTIVADLANTQPIIINKPLLLSYDETIKKT